MIKFFLYIFFFILSLQSGEIENPAKNNNPIVFLNPMPEIEGLSTPIWRRIKEENVNIAFNKITSIIEKKKDLIKKFDKEQNESIINFSKKIEKTGKITRFFKKQTLTEDKEKKNKKINIEIENIKTKIQEQIKKIKEEINALKNIFLEKSALILMYNYSSTDEKNYINFKIEDRSIIPLNENDYKDILKKDFNILKEQINNFLIDMKKKEIILFEKKEIIIITKEEWLKKALEIIEKIEAFKSPESKIIPSTEAEQTETVASEEPADIIEKKETVNKEIMALEELEQKIQKLENEKNILLKDLENKPIEEKYNIETKIIPIESEIKKLIDTFLKKEDGTLTNLDFIFKYYEKIPNNGMVIKNLMENKLKQISTIETEIKSFDEKVKKSNNEKTELEKKKNELNISNEAINNEVSSKKEIINKSTEVNNEKIEKINSEINAKQELLKSMKQEETAFNNLEQQLQSIKYQTEELIKKNTNSEDLKKEIQGLNHTIGELTKNIENAGTSVKEITDKFNEQSKLNLDQELLTIINNMSLPTIQTTEYLEKLKNLEKDITDLQNKNEFLKKIETIFKPGEKNE